MTAPAAPALSFGPFELLEPLGGGMAIVYRARRHGEARELALKLLRQDRLLDGEARERFARERRALQQLVHPCICPLLEAGEVDGLPYLCMPLLRGRALSACIDAARQVGKQGQLALPGADPQMPVWAQVVSIIAKVADALHAAHVAGFRHRDVKPGNLWIDERGEPVLLDFGLAHDSADRYRQLTRTGQVVGTPTYLAPEQLDSRLGPVDALADVYGLCAVLYEAVTLAPPFRGNSRSELFADILAGLPADPRRFRPELPEGLALLLEAGMARNRQERYASAAALAADLRRLLAGQPPLMQRPSFVRRLLRRARRRSPPVILCGALLAALFLSLLSYRRLAQAATENTDLLAGREIGVWPGRLGLARAAYQGLPPPWPQHMARYADWLRQHGEPLLLAPAAAEQAAPDLHTFARAAVAEAGHRLEFAEALQVRSIEADAVAWAKAGWEVAADARFAGRVLQPQIGLVPLGADRGSGLQEFYDLASGDPELPVPQRDAVGQLQVAQRHGIVFVLVPGGSFQPPGSREVVALDPFLLAKHELTRWQHACLDMGNDQSELPLGPVPNFEVQTWRHPVNMLRYFEVKTVLQRWGMEIPTVVQWQRAALAGGTDEAPAWKGNYSVPVDGFFAGAPVGTFAANDFGFFDMLGNQLEYCADAAGSERLPARPGDGLRGVEDSDQLRLVSGGSFGSPPWRLGVCCVDRADQPRITNGVRPMRRLLWR